MARTFELICELGAQVQFASATVRDEVSAGFAITVNVVSRSQELDLKLLLGKKMTVKQTLPDGGSRFFNGRCKRVEQLGPSSASLYGYRFSLAPSLSFLSMRTNCKIFQHKTIPDVLKEVLGAETELGFEMRLSGKYEPWEYCVQYRETTLNFVTRLMEQEGIYYFFEHSEKDHKLILCDNLALHKPIAGVASLPFFRPGATKSKVEHISGLAIHQELQPGKYAIDEYDPLKPSTPLFSTSEAKTTDGIKETGYEVFDYPGEYDTHAEGNSYANIRLEEIQSHRLVFHAQCEAHQITAGSTLTIEKHPVKQYNAEYFITGHEGNFSEGGQEAGTEQTLSIETSFNAIKGNQQYRPTRKSPRPLISGVQTAIVVGKSGDEIYTDDKGRVCVQFFWDRIGTSNEKSSCWIRVATPWASGQFGVFSLPRVGDEVVVTFLEGDPDRPLITGSVYNAQNKPPYAMPADKTQSGIRSKSTKGGGASDFNEIRFEDKKGSEIFAIQAQHDFHSLTKHDHISEVKSNTHLTVGANQSEKIGGKQHLEVKLDQSTKVGGTYSLDVKADWMVKSGASLNAEAGSEIHLKSGGMIVLEAAAGITIKSGGSFITVNPGGVFIQGPMTMINSGGPQLSGSGLRLNAPAAPAVSPAVKAKGSKPKRKSKAPLSSGTATTLKKASKDATAFCEDCAAC